MSLVFPHTKLSDAILEHLSLIRVVNLFGVRLGTAEKTVLSVCEEHNIDPEFFLAILNTHLNDNYFPEKKLLSFRITDILDYLDKSNLYCLKVLLPNIERHLMPLLHSCGPENKTLAAVGILFSKVKKTLSDRYKRETEEVFPSIRELYKATSDVQSSIKNKDLAVNCCHENGDSEPESTEEAIFDLKNILIRHVSGTFDDNLVHATIFSLDSLEEYLRQQNRIRLRIFLPMTTEIRNNSLNMQ